MGAASKFLLIARQCSEWSKEFSEAGFAFMCLSFDAKRYAGELGHGAAAKYAACASSGDGNVPKS